MSKIPKPKFRIDEIVVFDNDDCIFQGKIVHAVFRNNKNKWTYLIEYKVLESNGPKEVWFLCEESNIIFTWGYKKPNHDDDCGFQEVIQNN